MAEELISTDTGVLSDLFNLDKQQLLLLDELFEIAKEDIGFDAGKIFQDVENGAPFSKALGLPEDAVDLLYSQAFARFNSGQPEQAERLFRALCLIDGRTIDHWLGYGICLRIGNKTNDAQIAFVTARQLQPESPLPLFHLLELFVFTKSWSQADQCLRALDGNSGTLTDQIAGEIDRYRIVVENHTGKQSLGRGNPQSGGG